MTTYAYDPLGRTLQVRHADAAGAEIDRAFYAYDAAGRPLFKDTASARHTYAYDAVDRLLGEETAAGWTTYAYDASGRRISVTDPNNAVTAYAYDAADELLSAGDLSYGYDANGSRVTMLNAVSGDLTTYTWDAVGRLSIVALPDGSLNTYTYAEDGLRHRHTGPDGRDELRWDRNSGLSDPLTWAGQSGSVTQLYQTFVQEPNAADASSHLVRSVGQTRMGLPVDRQFYPDAQGTAEATVGAGGSGTTTFTFDAFGNGISPADAGSGAVVAVTDEASGYLGGLGYWRDADVGLSYVRQRWYDPQTGQWLSVDPVDGEPRYAYAHNSPTRGADPSGTLFGFNSWQEFKDTWSYLGDASKDVYGNPIEHAFSSLQHCLGAGWQRIAKWFTQAQAWFKKMGHSLLQAASMAARNLAPSAWDPKSIGEYVLGIAIGIFEGILGLCPIGLLIDIFLDFLESLIRKGSFIQTIVEMVEGLGALFHKGPPPIFTQDLHMPDYDRGKTVGNILVTLLLILGTIFTGGAGAAALVAVSSKLVDVGIKGAHSLVGQGWIITEGVASSARSAVTEALAPRPAYALAGGPNWGSNLRPLSRAASTVVKSTAEEAGSTAGEVGRATSGAVKSTGGEAEQAAELTKKAASVKKVLTSAKDQKSALAGSVAKTTEALLTRRVPLEFQERLQEWWQNVNKSNLQGSGKTGFINVLNLAKNGNFYFLGGRVRQWFDYARDEGLLSRITAGVSKDPILGESTKIAIDHIVPIKDLVRMPGFVDLTPGQMAAIVTYEPNLVAVGAEVNKEKLALTWEEWLARYGNNRPHLNRPFVDALIRREKPLRIEIQKLIDELRGSGS